MMRVWIVDDNVSFSLSLQLALTDGFNVRTFHDPQKCLEAISSERESRPDIILTDFEMPGIDGIQLIEAIKKYMPEVKSYLLSANLTEGIIAKAKAAGAIGWVGKMGIEMMEVGQWLKTFRT